MILCTFVSVFAVVATLRGGCICSTVGYVEAGLFGFLLASAWVFLYFAAEAHTINPLIPNTTARCQCRTAVAGPRRAQQQQRAASCHCRPGHAVERVHVRRELCYKAGSSGEL